MFSFLSAGRSRENTPPSTPGSLETRSDSVDERFRGEGMELKEVMGKGGSGQSRKVGSVEMEIGVPD